MHLIRLFVKKILTHFLLQILYFYYYLQTWSKFIQQDKVEGNNFVSTDILHDKTNYQKKKNLLSRPNFLKASEWQRMKININLYI